MVCVGGKKMGYAPCAHQALCAPCRDAGHQHRTDGAVNGSFPHVDTARLIPAASAPASFCAIVDSSPPKGGIDALASEQATAVQPCRRA